MIEETESGLFVAHGNKHLFVNPEYAKAAELAALLDAMMSLTYLTTATATAMIATITGTGAYMGIGTGGSYGSYTELVAGTAYTAVAGGRPPITWAAFSTDHQTSNDTQTYALLLAQTGGIPWFAIYTANTGGTLLCGGPTTGLSGSIPLGANVTFTSSVTLTIAG